MDDNHYRYWDTFAAPARSKIVTKAELLAIHNLQYRTSPNYPIASQGQMGAELLIGC